MTPASIRLDSHELIAGKEQLHFFSAYVVTYKYCEELHLLFYCRLPCVLPPTIMMAK
jgi:hypothetical protein